MCGAPCAAAIGRGGAAATITFHLARAASYAVGGAVAAVSVSSVASWSQFTPVLRPLWTLVNAAAFALGLWLVWKGQQPAWLGRIGRVPAVAGTRSDAALGSRPRVRGPLRAGAAGGLWVAWPCGLLQSALLVAALTDGALAGATVMVVFAATSAPGLVFGPWVWQRLLRGGDVAARERWLLRAAGLLIVVASGWALSRGLWERTGALCVPH